MIITTAQYYNHHAKHNCCVRRNIRKLQNLKKILYEIHDDRAGLGLGLATAIADEEATDDTMTKAAAAAEDETRKDIATEEGKDRGTGEGDRIPGKDLTHFS